MQDDAFKKDEEDRPLRKRTGSDTAEATATYRGGKRKKVGTDNPVPCILAAQGNEKIFTNVWARFMQKIYEADPLVSSKYRGTMRMINFIEDGLVICAILASISGLQEQGRRRSAFRRDHLNPNSPIIALSRIKIPAATRTSDAYILS